LFIGGQRIVSLIVRRPAVLNTGIVTSKVFRCLDPKDYD
jgi:hypothetical protein